MTNALAELLEKFESLPEDEQEDLKADVLASTKGQKWFPNLGPQTDAYFCQADELFYGGQAGGGKSALLCGLAMESHERSLILRRFNKDAKKLANDELVNSILDGDRSKWNGTDLVYRDGLQQIEFGGCEHEEDKQRYKGDPHDLIGFDEIPDFLESQYRFIIGWNRSTKPGQRCRIVCAGNPPTTAEGLWIIQYWAPWLDPKYPRPAKPGELRWFINDEEGRDQEVDGRGPHIVGEREVYARSRTFIPAELDDNPDLAEDGEYARVLDSLPKELRDAYRDGRFDTGIKDDPWQLIPTAWVKAAQARWTPEPPDGVPMCALGVDVAQGGTDNNVIAARYDGWYAPLVVVPGKETPVGVSQAGLIVSQRRDGATVIIDCGGGYGGTAYADLKDNFESENPKVIAYKGSEKSSARTKDRMLEFGNRRSQVLWQFREALDPAQPGGSRIMLPEDPELVADLTSVRYEVRNKTIWAEPKEKLVKRLGRSTDKGDSACMAWSAGPKRSNSHEQWRSPKRPKVNMGHAGARRKLRR